MRGPMGPSASHEAVMLRTRAIFACGTKSHREACAPIGGAPIGGELSITAGEPQANLRKGTTPLWGPHRGPTSRYRG